MKKRALSLFLALALLWTLLPTGVLPAHAEVYSGTCGAEGDNLTWSFDIQAGILTISGSGDMAEWEDHWEVPWYYELHSQIKSVELPEGLTSIGARAFFDCEQLTSVAIGSRVSHIGRDAFCGCKKLTSATIGNGVKSIGWNAFRDCIELTKVMLPEGVENIGDHAFFNCSAMKEITLPSDIIWIGRGAIGMLSDSSSGSEKPVPGFTIRGYSCTEAQTYAEENGITFISLGAPPIITGTCGDNLIWTLDRTTAMLTIEGTGAMIDWDIFANSNSPWSPRANWISSLSLSNGLTSIGNYAFFSHEELTSVKFPDNVKSIGEGAFEACKKLASISIPDGVVRIDKWAFWGCLELTSVTIPASVREIGEHAFGYYWDYDADEESPMINFTIIGSEGSEAQRYAEENGFRFVALPTQFVDVPNGAYYVEPVSWAVENKITNGTGANTFSPDATCTRGQVVTFLWRAKGCPEPTSMENPFKDVKTDDYFYKAVLWAKETGVTSGTSATTFSPGNGCTRAQVVTFLWRAEGMPEPVSTNNPFNDVPAGEYYTEAVLWAVGKGVTTFSPGKTCTRGQIVTFLYRDLA